MGICNGLGRLSRNDRGTQLKDSEEEIQMGSNQEGQGIRVGRHYNATLFVGVQVSFVFGKKKKT
jgi:hypothetical protein